MWELQCGITRTNILGSQARFLGREMRVFGIRISLPSRPIRVLLVSWAGLLPLQLLLLHRQVHPKLRRRQRARQLLRRQVQGERLRSGDSAVGRLTPDRQLVLRVLLALIRVRTIRSACEVKRGVREAGEVFAKELVYSGWQNTGMSFLYIVLILCICGLHILSPFSSSRNVGE